MGRNHNAYNFTIMHPYILYVPGSLYAICRAQRIFDGLRGWRMRSHAYSHARSCRSHTYDVGAEIQERKRSMDYRESKGGSVQQQDYDYFGISYKKKWTPLPLCLSFSLANRKEEKTRELNDLQNPFYLEIWDWRGASQYSELLDLSPTIQFRAGQRCKHKILQILRVSDISMHVNL
ncbi:hypothetical protein SADUNF_Sadunf08G0029600 [Salix dunnii]|uniref:Uncharacterized protein n=1 Tax=Salix dunnii TaxID=1413687 RepID=A0A835K010_9ROSI|nr:hypothetical protein SADUNF_Sadunf08G0029600 [Salix dunnii]